MAVSVSDLSIGVQSEMRQKPRKHLLPGFGLINSLATIQNNIVF